MRSIRLRLLIVLAGLAAAALVAAAATISVEDALVRQLGPRLSSSELESVIESAHGAIIASAVLALVAILPLSIWVGDLIAGPLRRLRTQVGRATRRGDAESLALVDSRITEVRVLARAIAHLVEDRARRTGMLERKRDELTRVIDSVGEGIIQVDGAGRLARVNASARALLHLPADAVGMPIAKLLRSEPLRETIEAAARGEDVAPFEVILDERAVLVAARPSRRADDEDGPAFSVLATFVDITELRRLESVRRDFVANASHELKTPLTSIRGFAETILGDDLPADTRREFLETIHQNAVRLHNIVEDLLDLSRIESGGWIPEVHEVEPGVLARETWSRFERRARERRIEFKVVDADAPIALADPFAVRQILANLFSNALRYTPPEGTISVRIHGAPPAWTVVEVTDTGAGIPGDALPRIFERFYRADPARSRAEGGTGLGLAIVKHLVEQMGGDIVAESALGRGTTIRFRLPVAEPVQAAGSVAEPVTAAIRGER